MSHNILLTGASGYLGGTLLARLQAANLTAYDKFYALVRKDSQAKAVKDYGVEPLTLDVSDESAVYKAVVEKGITIVFFQIDAMSAKTQRLFIKALGEVGRSTGKDTHFIHTSGAKLFSSHAGAPTDRLLYDDEPDLFNVQKSQRAPITPAQPAVEANNEVIEECEKSGVHGYISIPCIVYGKGQGFGNQISIQTVAIVRAAHALRQVHSVDSGRPTWPVCHVLDHTTLQLSLLRAILSNNSPPCGKKGYYLAASGSVAWLDIYEAMARGLAKRGAVDTESVTPASDDDLGRMAEALGVPKGLVALQLGGLCTFTARNGQNLGWKPEYKPEHILEAADDEVALILENLKD